MKFEPTISIQKFVSEMGKKSNIGLYPVKSLLDQVEIGSYLPTFLDGITITEK